MRPCTLASSGSHSRHLSYHSRKLVEIVSEIMRFILQFSEAVFPALFVSAHSIQDGFQIVLLARPLVGYSIKIMAQLFRSSLASLYVQKSRVHRSGRALDDSFNLLVAL
jgi:hypothetical protein